MNNAKYAIYRQIYEADDCQKELNNITDFIIRLRNTFIDNDKPVPALDTMFCCECLDLEVVELK